MDDHSPNPPNPLPRIGLQEALLLEEQRDKTQMDKIIEMILDPANIAHNTELTRNEIIAFSALATLADRHPKALETLDKFLKTNMILRVSKGRKGRGELIRILNQNRGLDEMQGMNGMAPNGQRRGWWRR